MRLIRALLALVVALAAGVTAAEAAVASGRPSPVVRVGNPYLGARGYLNRDYGDKVNAAGTAEGGALGE
ncbi:hypothetical protein Acor_52710 [Acrocarpospora corrugata]|uniref:Uncharacterized protein n=1 Tax=Acrocarpospora corrugata TaxID=35763 RepID=A0A5M3W2E4_9ACTN|nr:hypothetical protein [Acrocarpospora corrugata]GES03205.1 hypothetical protein Acor_52710 [Acrocarpospora corrugata]